MASPTSADPRQAWLRRAFERYETPLLGYALRLLNGHQEAAQDAVQETFLQLCRVPSERVEGRLAPWLFAVCRNRVIDMKRRDQHHLSSPEMPVADPSPGPEQMVQEMDEFARLQQLVSGLPEHQRELLHLRLQVGLSYREIAEVTGLTVTNVGYHLHAAIRSLREHLTIATKNQTA